MILPLLNREEKIVLWSQSSLYIRDSWQQGYLFLTNKRLIFNNVTKTTYEASLDKIIELGIERRIWFFGVRVRQLCVLYNSEKGQEKVYLTLAKPRKWSDKIKEGMALMLAEGWGYNGADTESAGNT